jgi:hypothetical protein
MPAKNTKNEKENHDQGHVLYTLSYYQKNNKKLIRKETVTRGFWLYSDPQDKAALNMDS